MKFPKPSPQFFLIFAVILLIISIAVMVFGFMRMDKQLSVLKPEPTPEEIMLVEPEAASVAAEVVAE